MIQLPILGALFMLGMASPPRLDCRELVEAKIVAVSSPAEQQACVIVTILPAEATQVIAEHPVNVTIRVSGEGREILADGFQFGQETITFIGPGRYRIEVSAADVSRLASASEIHMSRKRVALQTAAEWQAAEALAVDSKHTPTIPAILASLERWQALQDPSSIARTWLKLGDATLAAGDLRRASDAYEQAREICRSIGDIRCCAEAANNSGSTLQQLGNLTDSFLRLEEAARSWQELSLPLPLGKTLSNMAIAYSRVADFQRAITTYDRAAAILRPLDSLAYARVLNNLGLCYLTLAQYELAETDLRRAIAIEVKLQGAKRDWIRARLNLARTLMLQGRLQPARGLMAEIVVETEAHPDPTTRAFALSNLGQTLLRLGLNDAADSSLREALELHRTLGDRRGEAIDDHYLGLIARVRGDLPAARQWLNQALEIRRRCGLRDDAADSLFALAELEFSAGESAHAQSLAEEAVPLLESVRNNTPGPALRASYYARRRNLLDLLVAIAMRPDNPNAVSDGLIASEFGRSRSLLDIVSAREGSSSQSPELIERQAAIRREINFLSLLAADESKPHKDVKPRLEALLAEDQQVEARIRESMENREPGGRPLASIASLQSEVLSPESGILEYQLGERGSYVWLIRRETIQVFTLPARTLIERQISTALSLFAKPNERRADPAMQQQFTRAMMRLSATLLGKLDSSPLPPLLMLVLDGSLHRVPFAALRLSTGEYLGFRHDLIRAPSAAFLQHGASQPLVGEFPKSILALYDPIFSGDDPRVPQKVRKSDEANPSGLARLPFNNELQVIKSLVPPSRRDFLGGFDASVAALASLPLERYAILHLSTHAMINEDVPELSRIALSVMDRRGNHVDGFLFPPQLAGLHLARSTVVLSACETALGKQVPGEGLIGFASSLFSAGASQLVLTVSQVDAQASSVFLRETYRHVFAQRPESMEHALTLARRSLLLSNKYRDPYYWASFVIIGMPRFPVLEASY